jgi:putative addiction module antidote
MLEAKIISVGAEKALVLPQEALDRLQAKEGDTVLLIETKDGILVRAVDEEYKKTMAMVEDIMRRYDNTLRELAK